MEVNGLVTIATITILLAGLVLLGLSDTDVSVPDTNVYYIETTNRRPEASNSSASATITITMCAMADE
ncbi:MAG: hypothetical protein ACXACF_06585 [Candidatus Hermodarchaeia archaeon]